MTALFLLVPRAHTQDVRPSGDGAAYRVVGRDEELAQVRTLLDRDDGPAGLVVEGDIGAGKSTLVDAALDLASSTGHDRLVARPADGEEGLAFVGLRDLLTSSFLRHGERLPPPQRTALAAALLLQDAGEAAPEPGAVGAAVLSLLSHAVSCAERGVLLVVDDVQWLDRASGRALRFALRRLDGLPLAVLVTTRPGGTFDLLKAERMELGGLTLGAVHHLVQDRVGVSLARPALRRVHEVSAGNPLYALEIVRDMTSRRAAGASEPARVPPTLVELVDSRLTGLSRPVQRLLGVVAAAGRATVPQIVEVNGSDVALALSEALDAGVLVVDGADVRFAHPLEAVRVYAKLLEPERQRIHARLAATVIGRPDEHARHLALSVAGPDEKVADAIELAAAGTLARGAVSTAALLYGEARRLTPAPESQTADRRALEEAWCHFLAGDTRESGYRLDTLIARAPSDELLADAMTKRGRLLLFTDQLDDAGTLFDDVRRLEGATLAAQAAAAEGSTWVTLLSRGPVDVVAARATAAAGLAERMHDPARRAEAEAVAGLARVLRGDPDGLAQIDRAARRVGRVDFARAMQHPRFSLAIASAHTDRLEQAERSLIWLRDRAGELGDESSATRVLFGLAYVCLLTGNWGSAEEWVTQGERAADETGQQPLSGMLLMSRATLAAYRGDVETVAAASGRGVAGRLALDLARGHLALSLGDAASAYAAVAPVVARCWDSGYAEPGAMRFAVEEVEALIGLGRRGQAVAQLARLEDAARATRRHSVLAGAARCRGLLAVADGGPPDARSTSRATAAFETALHHHGYAPMPFERARTLLAYGAVLRRARQKRAARDALREAHRAFDALGAAAWAQRAGDEAARIGGRTPAGGLTETERRVVELAADGLSNVEIARRLFVTTKTVEGHLSHAYVKLGVRSRAGLARALVGKGQGFSRFP